MRMDVESESMSAKPDPDRAMRMARDALASVAAAIEDTYDHDETGARNPDGCPEVSASDTVEALLLNEQLVFDALAELSACLTDG